MDSAIKIVMEQNVEMFTYKSDEGQETYMPHTSS